MDDFSLEDLQAALQSAQQEQSTVRLRWTTQSRLLWRHSLHNGKADARTCPALLAFGGRNLPHLLQRERRQTCVLQVKLSDRNVVELVNKLQECGLLGDDLLHSVNGREYVTADHLKTEVTGAVEGAGGRIAVVSSNTPTCLSSFCMAYIDSKPCS